MDRQVPLDERARADTMEDDGTHGVSADVAYQRLLLVNVVFGASSANCPPRQLERGAPTQFEGLPSVGANRRVGGPGDHTRGP